MAYQLQHPNGAINVVVLLSCHCGPMSWVTNTFPTAHKSSCYREPVRVTYHVVWSHLQMGGLPPYRLLSWLQSSGGWRVCGRGVSLSSMMVMFAPTPYPVTVWGGWDSRELVILTWTFVEVGGRKGGTEGGILLKGSALAATFCIHHNIYVIGFQSPFAMPFSSFFLWFGA